MVQYHALFIEEGGSAFPFGSFLFNKTSQSQETASTPPFATISSIVRRLSNAISHPVTKVNLPSTPIQVLEGQILDDDDEVPAIWLTPSSPPSTSLKRSNAVRYPGFLAPPLPTCRTRSRRRRHKRTKESVEQIVQVKEDEDLKEVLKRRQIELRSPKRNNKDLSRGSLRGIVSIASQNIEAFPFCQEYSRSDSEAEHRSMMAELREVLRFGNTKGILAPLGLSIDLTGSNQTPAEGMQRIRDLSTVIKSIQDRGSYATFPVSGNLIVFARVLSGLSESRSSLNDTMLRPTFSPQQEIAELLLHSTEDSENHADMYNFPVVGSKMLDCYLQVMAKTRVEITFTGWYKALESNRTINRERLIGSIVDVARASNDMGGETMTREKTEPSGVNSNTAREAPYTTKSIVSSRSTNNPTLVSENLSKKRNALVENSVETVALKCSGQSRVHSTELSCDRKDCLKCAYRIKHPENRWLHWVVGKRGCGGNDKQGIKGGRKAAISSPV